MSDNPKDAIKKLQETAEGKKVDKKEEKREVKDAKDVKQDHKDAKIDELTNDLKRVQADFENYKKRVEKENAKFREYSKAELITKLLPVLDSFDIAIKSTKNNEEFVKGVELIYAQLHSILKEEGLQPICAEGKRCDPYLHEVMLFEKSDRPEDTVLEELQRGYRLKDCVLRHSKVKVSKK
jgi:molecular chaperone GrpE